MTKLRARLVRIWSAVTCHRFHRYGDLSPKQDRVQRPDDTRGATPSGFDGDKSPAESADKSAHSKALGGRTTKFEVFLELLLTFLRTLWPSRSPWRRYRATPRTNPATLRRALRRSIRDELRASGFHLPRVSRGTTL